MGSEVYSDLEKELFELLNFMRKAHKRVTPKNENEKQQIEDLISTYDKLEQRVKGFAEGRHQKALAREEESKSPGDLAGALSHRECEGAQRFGQSTP